MPFVIENDNGEGNPPSFYQGTHGAGKHAIFGPLDSSAKFATEAEAQKVIDTSATGCIVMPLDNVVFEGSGEKTTDELAGITVDAGQDAVDPKSQNAGIIAGARKALNKVFPKKPSA